MVDTRHVFQISGIKNIQLKGKLLHGIHQLGGKYIGGSAYKERTTHLIASRPLASEKLLAACAGGKWLVTPEYVLDSVRNGVWLPEEAYELDITSRTPGTANPIRVWRERVSSGSVLGAFQHWSVVLLLDDRSDIFKRILTSGRAKIHSSTSAADHHITHVLTDHMHKGLTSQNAPCYSVVHIAQHLFGSLWSEMGFSASLGTPMDSSRDSTPMDTHTELEANCVLFADLENQLRERLSKLEHLKRRLVSTEFLNFATTDPQHEIVMADFSNVQSLIECGFLTGALEEIQGALLPGHLPPMQVLQSLMHQALHAEVKPYFYSTFRAVLHDVLRNNPPQGSPVIVKYFQRVLQCPQCKGGTWSLLEMSVRVCMSSGPTCHSLPSPASPEQIRFHVDLQTFLLKLFQFELHASNTWRPGGSRLTVLGSTFWSVWDRSSLCTRSVQQLAELLIQASLWALPCSEDWQSRIVGTLHDILAVVVEYFCQEHSQLNRNLVEKGLADFAEYISILCQDLPPEVLQEFIPSLPSVHLRMYTADAVFAQVCCRNGIVMGSQPLSLRKIVSSYLPALGRLGGRVPAPAGPQAPQAKRVGSEPGATSCAVRGASSSSTAAATGPGSGSHAAVETGTPGASGLGKENVPRGLNRVNAAGETLMHRACKKNQVETLLHILSLPGTDVNVKGSSLLQLQDGQGRTALDLVSSPALKEELRTCAQEGDSARDTWVSEVRDLAFLEACSCLLSCLLLSYALVRDIPSREDPRLACALATYSAQQVTAGWSDPRLVRHAEDLDTLLGVERYLRQVPPAVRNCQGRNTRILMRQLEELESDAAALLSKVGSCVS